MPELPDVAAFKMYLDSTSLKQTIEKTHVTDNRILKGITEKKLQSVTKNQSWDHSRRHGKYIFAHFDDRKAVILHFGMTGYLDYSHDGEFPKFARVIFDFDNGYHLGYISKRMLGQVSYTDNVERFIQDEQLGLDALDEQLTESRFHEIVAGKKTSLKNMLMDQTTIAGIGNVYADEILFHSRLHPKTKTNQLEESTITNLYNNMITVLKEMAECFIQNKQISDRYLLAHRDEKDSCPRCGRRIEKIKINNRSSYICPNCQEL